jgi:hypothetical protein
MMSKGGGRSSREAWALGESYQVKGRRVCEESVGRSRRGKVVVAGEKEEGFGLERKQEQDM